MKRLNLGCGNDIREGYINLDSANLPGVDVVWDLDHYPWPFEDCEFDEVIVIDVLEHLRDKIKPVEELWRITKPDALIVVQVPNWNTEDMWVDPTHRQPYTHRSFDFFDVASAKTIDRGYLSHARFRVLGKIFSVVVFGRTVRLRNAIMRRPIAWLGTYLNSVLRTIVFELRTVK